jgi:hypothetical protein
VFASYKGKKSEPFQKKQNSFSRRAEFGLSFGMNTQQPPGATVFMLERGMVQLTQSNVSIGQD